MSEQPEEKPQEISCTGSIHLNLGAGTKQEEEQDDAGK
jgi:hypothetical protein